MIDWLVGWLVVICVPHGHSASLWEPEFWLLVGDQILILLHDIQIYL